jgi:general nucleoside transport system permease protein
VSTTSTAVAGGELNDSGGDAGATGGSGDVGSGGFSPVGADVGRARHAIRLLRSPVPVAIAGGLIIGALIAMASGHHPYTVYREIFEGAFVGPNLTDTIGWAVPIVGMGLVAAVPLRGGMVNLGGDGQMIIGGLVSAIVAIYAPGPGPLRIVLAIAIAMLAAGLYAALPALAEATLGVPLLISTLLLNYPARYAASYVVRFPLRDEVSGLPQTKLVEKSARIPYLTNSSSLTGGLLLIIVAVIGVIWFDRRTPGGYELRMRGANSRFAAYGGVPLGRQSVRLLFVSGAIAGLVGAILVIGIQFRYTDGALLSPGYTYTGLMAGLLAGGEPIGTTIAAFGFAALQIGGFGMERATEVPKEITAVLQSVIILFLASRTGLVRRGSGKR